MTEENWDDFDEEAMDEMVRMFERMGMPVDVDVLRSLIKQVRNQFEQLGIDPKKVSMDEVNLGVDSDPEEFMKNFESMLSGPQGLGEFLKKMGVDPNYKRTPTPLKTEQTSVKLPEKNISDYDWSPCLKGKKSTLTKSYTIGQAYNKGNLVVLSEKESSDDSTGKRR